MLIFDFDGILLNSVYEAGVNAYNTITDETVNSFSELPPGCLESFVLNRFHFRPAGDSLPLMKWCIEHGAKTPDRMLTAKEYESILATETIPLKERTILFFEKRSQVIAKDRTAWAEMNRPYEPIWTEIRRAGAHRVVILTNKNLEGVLELAKFFDLGLVRENVYTGDGGVSKTENLNSIHVRFRAEDYLFVDDSLGNLEEIENDFKAAPFRLRLALGAWGYLGPGDREEAEKRGYDVFEQQDLIDRFDKELPR